MCRAGGFVQIALFVDEIDGVALQRDAAAAEGIGDAHDAVRSLAKDRRVVAALSQLVFVKRPHAEGERLGRFTFGANCIHGKRIGTRAAGIAIDGTVFGELEASGQTAGAVIVVGQLKGNRLLAIRGYLR